MTKKISQLAAAASLTGAELLEVSQLSASVTITAATISAQASDNSFNDSAAGFVAAGFAIGDQVRITGFTGNVANNIVSARITGLTTAKMTIGGNDGDVIVDDAAGEEVTITKWGSRRATADELAALADPTETTPPPVSYARNGLGVAWVEDFDFLGSAGDYVLQGVPLSAPQTPVTLDAADSEDDRIDVFVVNSSGAWAVVQGTPATPPVKPDIDPETQLEITFAIVPAASTEPDFAANTVNIYNEGTEWTDSRSGAPLNLTSAVDPYLGSVSIEATATTTGNWVRFVAPGDINLADYNTLVLYIKSKAAWPATRQLNVGWYKGNTLRGTLLPLRQGSYGFDSASTAAYQQIVIPLSAFVADGLPVDRLQITVGGTGATFGFFLDDIKLQGGLSALPSNALTWGDEWIAGRLYAARSIVHTGNTKLYVALRDNINATPASSPEDWQLMVEGTAGTVESVTGTGGITVDNTDPANPVVSLTNTAPKILQFAVSDETTDLTVGDDQITLRAPQAMTLTSVRASVNVAPTGSNMTIDLKVNGSSILSTKITIEAGEKSSLDATTQPVISSASIADDAEIQVDIDAVGSTIAGAGLKICMKGT